MADRKRNQCVWSPHPLEGYVLGHVTDVGDDNLTVELQSGQVTMGGAEVSSPPPPPFSLSLSLSSFQSITSFYDDIYPAIDEAFDKQVEDNCTY